MLDWMNRVPYEDDVIDINSVKMLVPRRIGTEVYLLSGTTTRNILFSIPLTAAMPSIAKLVSIYPR